jgi:uracil-DNA glycosylase
MAMSGGKVPKERQEALAALAWLFDAGIDTVVDEGPRDWLAVPAFTPPKEEAPKPKRALAPRPEALSPVSVDAVETADSLEALRAAVDAIRHGAIFADGEPASRVMIVGEGPSADDPATGRPFSGPSGALLDRMLKAIGRDRTSVYLANPILWRNPGGRPASEAEVATGRAVLRRHIALARPKAVLAMGGMPAKALLDTETGITKLRGYWHELDLGDAAVPLLPTFNPAYLLRVPAHKSLAWADLLTFKAKIDAD